MTIRIREPFFQTKVPVKIVVLNAMSFRNGASATAVFDNVAASTEMTNPDFIKL
jgi:hypothetical protein